MTSRLLPEAGRLGGIDTSNRLSLGRIAGRKLRNKNAWAWVGGTYPENLIKVALVHPEILDSHHAPRVFSIVHFCIAAAVPKMPDLHGFRSKNIGGGQNLLDFADLVKKA